MISLLGGCRIMLNRRVLTDFKGLTESENFDVLQLWQKME